MISFKNLAKNQHTKKKKEKKKSPHIHRSAQRMVQHGSQRQILQSFSLEGDCHLEFSDHVACSE